MASESRQRAAQPDAKSSGFAKRYGPELAEYRRSHNSLGVGVLIGRRRFSAGTWTPACLPSVCKQQTGQWSAKTSRAVDN